LFYCFVLLLCFTALFYCFVLLLCFTASPHPGGKDSRHPNPEGSQGRVREAARLIQSRAISVYCWVSCSNVFPGSAVFHVSNKINHLLILKATKRFNSVPGHHHSKGLEAKPPKSLSPFSPLFIPVFNSLLRWLAAKWPEAFRLAQPFGPH